ncbi:hypothetical protein ACJQWK_05777 [Exserohilum turcicum]
MAKDQRSDRRAKKRVYRAKKSTQDPDVVESKHDRISRENQTSSPFLRLSAELRNHIYDYCFVNAQQEQKHGSSGPEITPGVPSLAQVCRQIRTEFAPIFFSRATFRFGKMEMMADFSHSLTGGHRQVIKSVCLSMVAVDEVVYWYMCSRICKETRRDAEHVRDLIQFPSLGNVEAEVKIRVQRDSEAHALIRDAVRLYFENNDLHVDC